jgi:hypothetical protein
VLTARVENVTVAAPIGNFSTVIRLNNHCCFDLEATFPTLSTFLARRLAKISVSLIAPEAASIYNSINVSGNSTPSEKIMQI